MGLSRAKFYQQVIVNGIPELDFLQNNLSQFTMKYTPGYYRVTDGDLARPDLISYSQYNTVEYWWIICVVNEIQNPLNDLVSGQLLKIPNILDIYAWTKNYQVRS